MVLGCPSGRILGLVFLAHLTHLRHRRLRDALYKGTNPPFLTLVLVFCCCSVLTSVLGSGLAASGRSERPHRTTQTEEEEDESRRGGPSNLRRGAGRITPEEKNLVSEAKTSFKWLSRRQLAKYGHLLGSHCIRRLSMVRRGSSLAHLFVHRRLSWNVVFTSDQSSRRERSSRG